jgi:hypothetical protein
LDSKRLGKLASEGAGSPAFREEANFQNVSKWNSDII